MKLADDQDKDNRDWAIFAPGVIGNADSEEIKRIFLDHLHDTFADARAEAVASLGKRKDVRVMPMLIRMIANEGPGGVPLEAARDLLERDEDPPDWYAKEYIAALKNKFPEVREELSKLARRDSRVSVSKRDDFASRVISESCQNPAVAIKKQSPGSPDS